MNRSPDHQAPYVGASAFATKAGIDWTQLDRTTDGKGERFVHRSVSAGARTADLLQEVVAEALAAMPIPKPMRWGDHDYAFARPVHWLVVLLGDAVVPVQALGVASDRMSRGHRFEHDKPVWIGQPGDYVDALRAARVLVDPAQRRARIVAEVEQAAAAAGGQARITDDNLEQVLCLVEWPEAVLCGFERDFLAVPQEALVETMEVNQKFFPVLDAGGRLTEHFIGIANIASRDPVQVRKGYERVIRPRFADARFFFDEDLKAIENEKVESKEKIEEVVKQDGKEVNKEECKYDNGKVKRMLCHITEIKLEESFCCHILDRSEYRVVCKIRNERCTLIPTAKLSNDAENPCCKDTDKD